MEKKNLCILYGGKSGEHEVSTRSAASIVNNVDRERYNLILIGIDKSGRWHYQESPEIIKTPEGDAIRVKPSLQRVSIAPEEGIMVNGKILNIDVVFPVLHGTFGEDGTIQGALEIADIPYVGSGVLGSSVSMNKEKAKRLWRDAGLPIVDFELFVETEEIKATSKTLKRATERLGFPLFVKPNSAGSSVGVTKANNIEELLEGVKNALTFDSRVLIERSIDGREIECSVIGNKHPRAFNPGEIIPKHEFYDYEAKYTDPEGAELKIPAALPKELKERVKSIAVEAYKAVEAWGFSRVDFLLEKDTNQLYINEINTIPGFTVISMFPKLCENDGIPYPEIIDTLIELAIEKYNEKKSKKYTIEI